jgi:hypothetical protein
MRILHIVGGSLDDETLPPICGVGAQPQLELEAHAGVWLKHNFDTRSRSSLTPGLGLQASQ